LPVYRTAYTYGQDLERDEALPEIAYLDIRYAHFDDPAEQL